MNLKSIFNSQNIRVAAIGSIVLKFASALFALLNAIVLTRLLNVENFGIYILALTTVTILTIPVTLGLPDLLTRYISKYQIENDLQSLKGLLIRSNQMVLFSCAFTFFIAYLLNLIWWGNYAETLVETFWYALLLLPLLAFGELRAASLRGMKYIVLGQMPDTFLRNLFLFIALLTYYLLHWEMSPQKAMLMHCMAASFSFLIGAVFLYRKLLAKLKDVVPVFHTQYWLKQAIPFTVITSIQVIKIRSLIYFLAAFWSVEIVAIYDVANRGATLVSFTVDALNKAVSPYISSAFENKNHAVLQRIVKKTSRLIFAFSFPVALVFILGGKSLIYWLFGQEYGDSYIPLMILCIGYIVNALAGPLIPIFNMTNNQKYLSRNQLWMMFVSLFLGIPFIYLWGALGAATVFSILSLVQNGMLLNFIRRKLNLDSTIF